MDKNTIKKALDKRFLSEDVTPGISVTNKVKKESGKSNKEGVKAIEKDVTAYDKDLKNKDKDMSKMAANKFNYTDDYEKTYHDEMEIMNGQEMLQYDRKPDKQFKEKAKEGVEGSSRMGNEGKVGNAEAAWGGSSDDFGKDFTKRVQASAKKRSEQTPTLNLRGRDIQADIKDTGHKPYALEKSVAESKTTIKNNNPQIKESMKRLKFNKNGDKPFEGSNLTQKLGHALTLIPEGYKIDKKEFEMTDGTVNCRVRWEGSLNEGKAVLITATDKQLVNEDISRMKALFNYKSQDTLGTVKGNARLDENKAFTDVWNKSKKLLGESEEIEGQDAEKEAPFEEAGITHAPEAKKHVEGTTSTDKGTTSPKPKEGEWEKNVKGQAAEAKKHVEGTTSTDKGTTAPKPKEGEWEKKVKSQAPEAKKDISLKENDEEEEIVENKPMVPAKEEIREEEGNGEEDEKDDWEKPEEDDSAEEKEPSAADIKPEVPALNTHDDDDVKVPTPKVGGYTLKQSAGTGEYWIMKGEEGTKVPEQYLSIATDKSKKGSQRAEIIIAKMQEETDNKPAGELDEYGDEHEIPTATAVGKMKIGQQQ